MKYKLIMFLLIGANSVGVNGELPAQPVQVIEPAMLQLIAPDAQLEILADGFSWAEGPVAEPATGDILFSDVPVNKVYRWSENAGLKVYLAPSGYTGLYPVENRQQGANGLTFNQQQQLVLAQHGDRRLALLSEAVTKDSEPQYQTLVNHYQGKLLNSPNDVVQHSSGAYYFTDPPYGLKDGDNASQKQLEANAVYRLAPDGTLSQLVTELNRPNGLAFSPDEKWLYVANSERVAAQWWRYPVAADGSLGNAELFFDATANTKNSNGLPDGLKVLPSGHILATGPGGVWVFNAQGAHLGTIQTGVAAANVALAPNNRYLYITATNYLLRIALKPL